MLNNLARSSRDNKGRVEWKIIDVSDQYVHLQCDGRSYAGLKDLDDLWPELLCTSLVPDTASYGWHVYAKKMVHSHAYNVGDYWQY